MSLVVDYLEKFVQLEEAPLALSVLRNFITKKNQIFVKLFLVPFDMIACYFHLAL